MPEENQDDYTFEPEDMRSKHRLNPVPASFRHDMAGQRMRAADHFIDLCSEIENEGNGNKNEYTYYATAGITNAFASVEAAVNEFYRDAIDDREKGGNKRLREGLSEDVISLLANHWETIRGCSTLEKYQWALLMAGKKGFDKGNKPYQPIDDLRYLRNALVHFVPEWDDDQQTHEKVERRLQSYTFDQNPFIASGTPFFPLACLSRGCAEWAKRSALKFTSAFYKRLEIASIFESGHEAAQAR